MQFSIIFIDSEGEPIQELSALEMNFKTKEIVDVFHGHAFTCEADSFSRKHIHGLDPAILKQNGYENLSQLIKAFHSWRRHKHSIIVYGNDPGKECKQLKMYISDIGLDIWMMRDFKPYHEVALTFKKHSIPICGRQCCKEVHSKYQGVNVRPYNMGDAAKERHGYHCSLYDCFELYLFHVSHL